MTLREPACKGNYARGVKRNLPDQSPNRGSEHIVCAHIIAITSCSWRHKKVDSKFSNGIIIFTRCKSTNPEMPMPKPPPQDPKVESLRQQATLNPRPQTVTDDLFTDSEFFDPRDLVQVKYEMLRRVEKDGHSISEAATRFGFSRPSFYQARPHSRRRVARLSASQTRSQAGPQAHGRNPRVHSADPPGESVVAGGRSGESHPGTLQCGGSSANDRARFGSRSKKTSQTWMSSAAMTSQSTNWLNTTSNCAKTPCPGVMVAHQHRGWLCFCAKG